MVSKRVLSYLGYALLGLLCVAPAFAGMKLPAATPMIPMEQVGPMSIAFNPKPYDQVVQVASGGSIAAALATIQDAGPDNRYAVLVATGTYNGAGLQLKEYVDLYGGFDGLNWKARDVYENATVLDGQKKGPIVIGANNARIDGFVITNGQCNTHGAGILCDAVSPTIVNNIIVGNRTTEPDGFYGHLGKQVGSEGAGIMLLNGSSAYVSNNLFGENVTNVGSGAGISARNGVNAKILRNVFANHTAGMEDTAVYHGKIGSRSSPGAAIACAEASSPQISFNIMVMGKALHKNDAGGVWVEGNSMPLISYNWIAGNIAYDDGGGIYVMGNLYYDEEGKRHDLSPDGPAVIEDNFIVGNTSITGHPGGLRVSRWGRANLRRNRIVANPTGGAIGAEGGILALMENDIITDNEKDSKLRVVLTGNITSKKFNPVYYVTEMTTSTNLAEQDLAGAMVRIGETWSVVKSSSQRGLVVWGKIDDSAAKFEILDNYGAYTNPYVD